MTYRMALIGIGCFWRILGAQPLELNLKRAVEIALAPDGSARIQMSKEQIQQADDRAVQARAALLPNVSGQTYYQNLTRNLAAFGLQVRLPVTIPGFTGIPEFTGPFSVVDLRASTTQTILDLSLIRRYQASKVAAIAARTDEASARDLVTQQVSRAYLAALRATQALETARANVELAERLLRLAQSQKAAGVATGIDVTRAEVQLANERQRHIAAASELHLATWQLLRAINLPLETPVKLASSMKFVLEADLDLPKALETALAERSDWRAQLQREAAARKSFDAARWERLPSLSAFGDYGSLGASPEHARPTRTVGVTVQIPVWDGGRRDARRSESASQWRVEQIKSRDLRKQMELELRAAADALGSAQELVKAAEEAVRLAGSELAQAERRYKAGVGTGIEVIDAQSRLARAREASVNAIYLYNLARIDWHFAKGTLRTLVEAF